MELFECQVWTNWGHPDSCDPLNWGRENNIERGSPTPSYYSATPALGDSGPTWCLSTQATNVNSFALDMEPGWRGKDKKGETYSQSSRPLGRSFSQVCCLVFSTKTHFQSHNPGDSSLPLPENLILYYSQNFPLTFCKLTQFFCEMRHNTSTHTMVLRCQNY